MLRRSLAIGIFAIGASLALPLASHAYPAETTGDLNVRAGPGVRYARIGVLPRYTVVKALSEESELAAVLPPDEEAHAPSIRHSARAAARFILKFPRR